MNFKATQIKPFGVVLESNGSNSNVKDLDVNVLREFYLRHQLIVLRGFKTFQTADEFAEYCERWGEISVWPFGKVLDLIEQDNPQDHIFDHSYVPLHWDGMYRPQVPEYQIFHCIKAPLSGQGGRTTFSNTILALDHAPAEFKEFWSQVTGVYKRKMEFYNSKTVSPVLTRHPQRGFHVIRYNEPPRSEGHFVNLPDQEFRGVPLNERSAFHQSLREVLYSSKSFYAHEWQDADVVIADNFSLLHGREAFVAKSPRHLQRVQVLSNPPYANPGLESYL